MARGLAEDRSRRLGRVEMLLTELEQLPDGYQPAEEEVEQIKALAAKIMEVYAPPAALAPEAPPAAPAEEAVPAPEKQPKTENGKRKTGI